MIPAVAAVALALTATFLAAAWAMLAYGHHRRQALQFWQREQRLPDATRYENLKFLVEQTQAEYDELRDQLYDARELIDEVQRRREWMESVKQEIAQLEQEQTEVARVQNELETKQVELASLQESLSKLDAESKEKRDKIEQLLAEQAKLAREVEGLRSEASRANEIREALAGLEKSKQAAIREIEDLERNARGLREKLELELRALKEECNDVQQQRDRRQAKLDDLQKEIDKLAGRNHELEQQRQELQRDVKKMEGQAAALQGQIPTLQAAFDQISSAVQRETGAPDAKASELWQPVLTKGRDDAQTERDEIECLRDLQETLRSLGLRFDQRTVYAFHTALKTTSSSPLVTLAGVSGTGKSELPRRYADALGINFLNVAVQPRWDSPQDLFGFYDYLERRFRPTELTRALIQMDSLGPAADRGWKPSEQFSENRCANQMLLVLLDEMNLARVEYYFSEFLSKLETRRGVDVQDETKRRLAEIVLEVSGRQTGDPPLRLFVDKNVLFVGTMNEDESTQALSDKVIDRSNVLRFGSPNSIEPVASHQQNGQAGNHPPKMRRGTWESWYRTADDLADDDKRQMLTWIESLRDALDRVGRPFAYRVAYAMLEYAANYPQTDDRLRHVISDQIEQRILPKLIGMDLQQRGADEALRAITDILNEVDDENLRREIDESRRDDYFQWTGLDRTIV